MPEHHADDRLRIGLVGAGYVSEFHLRAWAGLAGAEVVALCDPNAENARRRTAEFNISAVYDDIGKMLAAETLHALDIASPREHHAAHVRLAVAHGLDVLCQKPLTPALAEAEQLIEEVGDRVRLMVHENWRFRPVYRLVGRWLRAGRLGRLRQCRMTVRSSALLADAAGLRPGLQRQGFMQKEKRLAIAELLIHHLDVVRWLCGPLAVSGAWTARTQPDLPGETLAVIVLEDPDGVPVIVDGNMTAPGYPPYSRDHFELVGDRASVLFEADRLTLSGSDEEVVDFDFKTGVQRSFDAVITHFVECLGSDEPFETGPEDNLRTLQLVERAYEMARRQ